ncbi:MAG: hypothetical protein K2X47_19480, partial [Bdellovibrionales bacterium]|nr:hypothetical protein [Bdellovibrionales bacterium]
MSTIKILFRNIPVVTLFLSVALSAVTATAGREGNGGDAVYCPDGRELLEAYPDLGTLRSPGA